MADYIERDKLQEALQRKKPSAANQRYTDGWNDCLMWVKSMVHGMSAANVVTQQIGYWESYDTSAYIGIDDFGEPRYARRRFYRCHRCRTGSVIKSNYCSYCGSKMIAYE